MAPFLFFLILFVTIPNNAEAVQDKDFPFKFVAQTRHGELVINLKSPVVYIPVGSESTVSILDFVGFEVTKDGIPLRKQGNFIQSPAADGPVEFKLISNEWIKFQIKEGNAWAQPQKSGDGSISLRLGDEQIVVPLQIRSLPYKPGQPADQLTRDLGFASKTEKVFVEWPINKTAEGVFYTVSASQSIRAIEQWQFEKLPYCVFSIEDGKICQIDSVASNPFDEYSFPKAFAERMNRIRDAEFEKTMSDLKENRERSNAEMIAQLEAEIAANEKNLKSANTESKEQFTLKDGTTIKASWIEFKGGKHRLEDEDGKTLEYANSELSAKTISRFKEIRKMLEGKKPKSGK